MVLMRDQTPNAADICKFYRSVFSWRHPFVLIGHIFHEHCLLSKLAGFFCAYSNSLDLRVRRDERAVQGF